MLRLIESQSRSEEQEKRCDRLGVLRRHLTEARQLCEPRQRWKIHKAQGQNERHDQECPEHCPPTGVVPLRRRNADQAKEEYGYARCCKEIVPINSDEGAVRKRLPEQGRKVKGDEVRNGRRVVDNRYDVLVEADRGELRNGEEKRGDQRGSNACRGNQQGNRTKPRLEGLDGHYNEDATKHARQGNSCDCGLDEACDERKRGR